MNVKTDYKNAYNIATKMIDKNLKNLRYVPMAFIGIYATCIRHYSLPVNDDVVNGVKDAILDFMSEELYGNCEVTFTEIGYDWWHNLKADSFDYAAGYNSKDIAYKEKEPSGQIFE